MVPDGKESTQCSIKQMITEGYSMKDTVIVLYGYWFVQQKGWASGFKANKDCFVDKNVNKDVQEVHSESKPNEPLQPYDDRGLLVRQWKTMRMELSTVVWAVER